MVLYAGSPIAEIISAAQKDVRYEGHNLTWWNSGSFYRYPALLINYFHQNKPFNFRQSMRVPPDVTVIGDSGGYEILSMRAKGKPTNINPLQVLKWHETNCDIGMTLDLSPVNLQPTGNGGKSVATNPNPISHEEFEKRLEQTCYNNQVFQDNRTNPHLKIYNVIHSGMGKTESISIWYERVKDFKFEGWAIAPKPPSDPVKVAIDGMFLWDRGVRNNLHVLGISGINVLPVLVYMEKYIKHISTDSFSYGVNAIVRKHMNLLGPPDFFYRPKERKYSRIPCLCPVCSNLKSVEDLYRTDIPGYSLIALHNLWQYLQYLKYLETLVEDREGFNKYVKNKSSKLKTAIDFIDNTVANGWETAISKLGMVGQSLERW